MKNVAVVVGGDHYNTLCVARSLGMIGYDPLVIIYGNVSKSFVTKSKYVHKYFFVDSDIKLFGTLKNLVQKDYKQVLISTSDIVSEVLDSKLDEIALNYYVGNCHGQQGELSYWMKKNNMLQAARESGFNVASTQHIDLHTEYEQQLGNISYPCIVKPAVSCHGSKDDFRYCKNEGQLKEGLLEIKEHCSSVLVQEYLKPDYEMNVVGVSVNNQCILPGLTHKVKTCQSVHDMGMIVMSYVSDEYGDLVNRDMVQRFIQKIGYSGLFSLDLLVSNGKLYFLEINLRSDGTMYMHTSAGVIFPQIWAEGCLFHKIEAPTQYKRKKTFGMTEISYVKYLDWKHPIQVIKDWWKTDCYSIFNWKDPLPFIYKFLYAIK